MHVHAPHVTAWLSKQQRFLAEHEYGRAAKKMRSYDCPPSGHRARAFDDGDGIAAGVGHGMQLAAWFPSPTRGREKRSRHAAFEPFRDLLARQITADEDNPALTLLVFVPWPLVVAVEDHVHALEHEALIVALEREDALAAQDVWAFLLHQILHPREELVGIERLVAAQRNRLHVLVVIVLEAAVMVRLLVMVIVAMIMVMAVIMIVAMIVIVPVAFEEFRFEVEDAVEIEGVAAKHLFERDHCTLGLVHLGIGIDAADARFDLAELVGRDEVGLVDEDHVGE